MKNKWTIEDYQIQAMYEYDAVEPENIADCLEISLEYVLEFIEENALEYGADFNAD